MKKFLIDSAKLLIGTDFEMFVKNGQGKFVSAIPFIEGTKDEPQHVSEKGHMIQHDGVLAEFNTPPVSIADREEMWNNIQFVLEEGAKRLPDNLKLECCTNGNYEESELEHPEAKIAGCSASFCAWKGGDLAPKADFGQTNDRCAGFHLHFSQPGLDVQSGMRLIRLLDVYVGLPLLFIDDDKKRRLLYGRAGDFRFKDYGNCSGVEYRVVSNVVIKNKEVFDYVWNGIKRAISEFNKDTDFLQYTERIEEAINNYNLEQAEQLCEEFEVVRLLEEEINA